MYRQYLVTGATGFLGRAVVSELESRGAEVRALVLYGDPLARELPGCAAAVEGDVCEEASLEAFFSGADEGTCVIHCAGIVSVASEPDALLYRVNVEGTRSILKQCFSHHVGKLIYVSSVHAISEKPKGTAIAEPPELSPELVQGDYGKSKAMATNLVKEAAENGLNVSIVFPSGIIGPGDVAGGSITQMLLSFLAGKLPCAVEGGYDFVDVRDVARGILACAESGRPGQGYILSGHYATIREILNIVKTAAGKKRQVLYLPLSLSRLIAPRYERYSLRRGKPLIFTPYSIAVLSSNGEFDHDRATRAFRYAPRPLQNTLRDTVMWLQKGGASRRKPYEA